MFFKSDLIFNVDSLARICLLDDIISLLNVFRISGLENLPTCKFNLFMLFESANSIIDLFARFCLLVDLIS